MGKNDRTKLRTEWISSQQKSGRWMDGPGISWTQGCYETILKKNTPEVPRRGENFAVIMSLRYQKSFRFEHIRKNPVQHIRVKKTQIDQKMQKKNQDLG